MRALLVLPLLVLIVGCGGGTDDAPSVVKVSGTLTMGGSPVPEAKLVFYPKEGGVPATATTDAEGKFTLSTKKDGDGAVPGTHQVTANNAVSPESSDPEALKAAKKNTLPAKYSAQTTTDLEVVVPEDGTDALDVELVK